MTDQAPGSGSSADQPADGPRDPGAGSPNPWSRESSGAGAHPLGADGPAPGGDPGDPTPPAPPAYGPPTYGPPPGAPGVAGPAAPYADPQPWPQPPTAGYGQQPHAEPAAYDPAPSYGQPDQGSGYGVNPYPGGYGGMYPSYGTPAPDHPQAMAALVTGIIALVTATFCGVGGLVGIASIILGAKARREIDSDPARYGGRSKATAGLVTGVIALVMLGIWLMVFVLIGASSPS
jgi:uncharacterized protein DUF4190